MSRCYDLKSYLHVGGTENHYITLKLQNRPFNLVDIYIRDFFIINFVAYYMELWALFIALFELLILLILLHFAVLPHQIK